MEKSKLSLEAFKAKASRGKDKSDYLEQITGGILGSCHVCTVSTYTFYYSNGGSGSQSCTVCTYT
jgi:hypothetical protein